MWYRLQDTPDSTVRVAKAAQPSAVPDEVVCVFFIHEATHAPLPAAYCRCLLELKARTEGL